MKTLINITAHAYDPKAPKDVLVPERTFTFIRPASAKSLTHSGAERMVAKAVGLKPSDVSVQRVEVMSCDA